MKYLTFEFFTYQCLCYFILFSHVVNQLFWCNDFIKKKMTTRKLVCYHEPCLISLKIFFCASSRNVFLDKWKGNWKQLILIEGSWLQKLYQLWNETLFINIIISKSQRKKWRVMVCPNHTIYLYVFIELIHDKGMIIQMCLFISLTWLLSLSYDRIPYIWNNKSNVNWNFSSFYILKCL